MAKTPSINKQELVQQVVAGFPNLDQAEIESAIDSVLSEISASLVCGDRVELRGFGSLVVRKRQKGKARNPKNGETVAVDDRGSLYFRASRDIIKALNETAANENN